MEWSCYSMSPFLGVPRCCRIGRLRIAQPVLSTSVHLICPTVSCGYVLQRQDFGQSWKEQGIHEPAGVQIEAAGICFNQ